MTCTHVPLFLDNSIACALAWVCALSENTHVFPLVKLRYSETIADGFPKLSALFFKKKKKVHICMSVVDY